MGVGRKFRRLRKIKGLVQFIISATSRNGWNPEQNILMFNQLFSWSFQQAPCFSYPLEVDENVKAEVNSKINTIFRMDGREYWGDTVDLDLFLNGLLTIWKKYFRSHLGKLPPPPPPHWDRRAISAKP
jgi:hypothetical protein